MNLERKFHFVLCCSILMFATVAEVHAQRNAKYSFAAQSKFIPKDLGRVYIGMPLRDFVKQIDVSKADIEDDRFEEIKLVIPFRNGNIDGVTIQIAGFPLDGREGFLTQAKATRRNDLGEEVEIDVKRLRPDKIPATAFVYVYMISFKPNFDQRSYVTRLYGRGTARDPNDQYHFSDIEWTKRTSDGLMWLIRSFHEGDRRSLLLYGRIKGTEWGIE